MQRRQFIRCTAAATASAALAAVKIDRIRVGLMGTGHSHFLGKLKAVADSPDYEVVSVWDGDAARRSKAAADPLLAKVAWVSEEKLLSDSSLHLIVVECRAWEALPWGKKVIDAGRHLHLEKPPGNDWKAFQTLMADARRKSLLVQTGYLWRFHQGVVAAIDAAKAGWLGDIQMVRGTMNSDRGPEERAIEGRYKGGGLFELGGHVVDRIVELLGRPTAVKSFLRHDTKIADQLADNNLAVFEYPKALAMVAQSAHMAGSGDHRSFEIIGTDGTFVVHPEANPPRMRVFMKEPHGAYKAGWQQIELPPQPRFIADFAELARALKTGTPLKQSYDHELLLQETLLRASGEMV
jgi:predicted dehydrogenase